jgi:hypothetical protein
MAETGLNRGTKKRFIEESKMKPGITGLIYLSKAAVAMGAVMKLSLKE